MTVTELSALLATLPGDALVVLAKDGEGNGYSPLADHEIGAYDPETTWCGEFRKCAPARAGDVLAVCLCPVN